MTHPNPLDHQFKLAQVWQAKGRSAQAIAAYRRILADAPAHLPTVLRLGELLHEQGQLSEAIEIFRKALPHHPNQARLHKLFIQAMTDQHGLDAAFAHYQLERRDDRPIDLTPDEVICLAVIRNERLRLPHFLDYYRAKGIRHFFVVDNHSTDDTLACLLEQPDVFCWASPFSFNQANHGTAWMELLLRQYGRKRWCVIVDADELFYYPNCETVTLPQFCQHLAAKNRRALPAVMLDMYANRPIQEAVYQPGQDFLDICPYFDRQFYHKLYQRPPQLGGQTIYVGGVRQRVFGQAGDYYLSKVPLLYYDLDCEINPHWTNLPPAEIATERGCLLHFKYFASFPDYVSREVEREEHYGQAVQYKIYAQELSENPTLNLYDPEQSVKFKDSHQLVELGIMQRETERVQDSNV